MAGKSGHRGFGYVRRLPSRRFQASYVGPDLVRHAAPSTFATKGDAEAWLVAERALMSGAQWSPPAGRAAARGDGQFGAYAASWLSERSVKARTRDGYQHLLDRYLLPAFGGVEMRDLTPVMVRRWWASLDPETPTVNARAYALLKAVLNTAVADEAISANPCRIKSASSAPTIKEIRPASVQELEVLVQALPENRRAIALLCSWCALRIGEALELRRKDVDLDRQAVSIERSVAWVRGRPIVGSPKSAAGRRRVSVPPHVLPALRNHLDQHVGRGQDALLFPARDGKSHLQPSVFHDAFRRARAAAGRDDLRVHDLRHTGATLAALTGATLAELQSRLGHSTVGAALRYQHAAQGRDAQIAAALSAMVAQPAPDQVTQSE